MKPPSDSAGDASALREKLLGAGLETMRKSYYPSLQAQLKELREKSNALLKTVSDLEQARREIEKREARFRVLIETAPVVIVVLDLQGRIVEFNSEAERVYNCRCEEALGKNYFDLFVPDGERESVMAEFQRIIAGGTGRGFENAIKSSDGGQRFFAWYTHRMLDEQGQITGILAIGQDITQRKQAEEEVLTLNRELEQRVAYRTQELKQANEELEAFSFMASHDLQGPLRRITSYSELLEQSDASALSQENREYAGRILEGAKKMNSLVKDLLTFSRVARGQLSREKVDLASLAQEVQQELCSDCQNRKINCKIGALPTVWGDRILLRQVLINLVSNALKYSKTRAEARIEIGTQANGVIYVRDNGVGFDSQYAERLFRPFERLHSDREFPGSGVGLAIVARIISRHGGRVWAESVVGQGACFYFSVNEVVS